MSLEGVKVSERKYSHPPAPYVSSSLKLVFLGLVDLSVSVTDTHTSNMAKALAVTSAVLAWLTLSHVATVHAQVFAEYPLSTAWPGISATCGAALNTTVQCSGILPVSAENK